MNNNKQYESIIKKLKKLQALAEQGYRGEAEAAKLAIERLCAQYGVTLEEILTEEKIQRYEFEIGRYEYFKTLFVHCHSYLTGKKTLSYYQRSRSLIAVDLTPMQYAELSNLFEWHKANFLQDLKEMQNTILEAYLNKHDLFSHSDNEDVSPKEYSASDLRRAMAIMAMQDQLNDNKYHKMLETSK